MKTANFWLTIIWTKLEKERSNALVPTAVVNASCSHVLNVFDSEAGRIRDGSEDGLRYSMFSRPVKLAMTVASSSGSTGFET